MGNPSNWRLFHWIWQVSVEHRLWWCYMLYIRYTPGHLVPNKWESCYTIQETSWGYDRTVSVACFSLQWLCWEILVDFWKPFVCVDIFMTWVDHHLRFCFLTSVRKNFICYQITKFSHYIFWTAGGDRSVLGHSEIATAARGVSQLQWVKPLRIYMPTLIAWTLMSFFAWKKTF